MIVDVYVGVLWRSWWLRILPFFGCLKKKTMTLRPSIKDARKIQCKTGYIQKWGNRTWMIPLYTSYLYMITWMIPALSSANSIWLFINHPRGHIHVITENNLFHCYLEAIVEIELEWIKHNKTVVQYSQKTYLWWHLVQTGCPLGAFSQLQMCSRQGTWRSGSLAKIGG